MQIVLHVTNAKATGPALRGIAAKYEMAWLYKWIKNSSELIKSGDPQAVKFMKKTTRQ
jgi:cytochrome c551/c552